MKTLVVATICLMLAGCGTYSETQITTLKSSPKMIALGEFKGNDEGIAQLFADTIAAKLSANGFQIITDQNQADIVITGTCVYKMPGWLVGSSDWILMLKTKEGSILATQEYHHPRADLGWKFHQEIINELSHRLIKFLQDAHNR